MRTKLSFSWLLGLSAILALALIARVQAAPSDAQFIDQAFTDLLNRPPSLGELTQYEADLTTQTRQQVAFDILTTTEYRQHEIDRIYSLLLNRSPTSNELASAVQSLTGGTTLEAFEASVSGSGEFFSDSGSTDDGFVKAIFSDYLNRPPAPLEVQEEVLD